MVTIKPVAGRIDRAVLSRFSLATQSEARNRQLPVGATALKRKTVIWPWIAILSAVLLVAIKAGQAGARGRSGGEGAVIGLALLAGAVVLLFRWIVTIRPARRKIAQIRAPFAYEVLANDHRLPIVLLRSFQSERAVAAGVPPFRKRIEEVLVAAAKPYGPAIAIGAPEDSLPELGAARAYVPGDNQWTAVALEWMRQARLVIVIAGSTPGLLWELERIIENGYARKTLIICPRVSAYARAVPRQESGPYLFAARLARAIGSDETIDPVALDDVIAIFPGANRELVMLKDGSFTASAYHRAVEQAIFEIFGLGAPAAQSAANPLIAPRRA